MSDEPPRKSWGSGRLAFVARLPTIRSEIGQGLPLTVIYERHKAALGVGYSAFVKLVKRHADDAKPLRRRSSHAAAPPSPLPSKPDPEPSEETDRNARHQPPANPAAKRPFEYGPITQRDEIDRLIGPKKGRDDAKE